MAQQRLDGVFRQRVYDIVRLVPRGQVATYGYVALLAGMPRHARQVGWALHTMPGALSWGSSGDVRRHPPGAGIAERASTEHAAADAGVDSPGKGAPHGLVPWHRVVNAQGRVSTHPDEYGTRRQIALLRQEGVDVSDDGTLMDGLSTLRWQPDDATVDGLELPAEVLFALDRLSPD